MILSCPSVCPSVQEPCMLGLWNFIYGFLMENNLKHVFFLVRVISLSGVMPFWKNPNEIWCMPCLMNLACFEEVGGAYWFQVVRLSARQEPCMLGFWNFIYGFLMEKYLTHVFFSCPSHLPFWSYAPLKKSERNLMHAISYEPCMLGFWNFIYGFLMEK